MENLPLCYCWIKRPLDVKVFLVSEFTWSIKLERNKMLTPVPLLQKTFHLTFDLFINQFGNDVWQNVVHFGTGTDNSRLPAIFVGNNKKCGIWFQSIYFPCNSVLGIGKWMKLDIAQYYSKGKVRRKLIIIFHLIHHISVCLWN